MGPCMCGDTECPSCGVAQGTRRSSRRGSTPKQELIDSISDQYLEELSMVAVVRMLDKLTHMDLVELDQALRKHCGALDKRIKQLERGYDELRNALIRG